MWHGRAFLIGMAGSSPAMTINYKSIVCYGITPAALKMSREAGRAR